MKNNYRLPFDYNSRNDYQKYVDGHDSLNATIYQPLVYKSAFEIVKKTGAKYLIDIGCGDGTKVAKVRDYSPDCKVIMIDHEFIIKNVTKNYDFAEYITADFDVEIPFINEDKLKDSVIICSDVIEHLLKPEILIEFLVRCKGWVKAIVISTPDRLEERGAFDYGPPANPYHVREWTLDEFTRMLMDYGFTNRMLAGLTVSNDTNNVKATLFCIISKYFEYEPNKVIHNESIECEELVFGSNLNEYAKRITDKNFDDDTWYLLSKKNVKLMPLMLRVSIDEHISLADYHGFNIITQTNLHIESINQDNVLAGKAYLHLNVDEEPVGAIKGRTLNQFLAGDSPVLKVYPFNILTLDYLKNLCVEMEGNTKFVTIGNWHENKTRKEFIVELAFGGRV